MKTGIMSMQRIVNYGSFMQAYGLKNIIENLGNEVVFVDYKRNPPIKLKGNNKVAFQCWFQQTRLWHLVRPLFREDVVYSEKQLKYQEDLKKYLSIGSPYQYHRTVDILVIGSDEVFNCLQDNKDVGYSLELFGKNARAKKVITYGASFGSTTLEGLERYKVTEEISKYLRRLDAICVRDDNSEKLVMELTGTIPKLGVDPVLISGVEKLFMNLTSCPKEPYLLVYGYSNRFSKSEIQQIKAYAQKEGLKLIALGDEQDFCEELIVCKPSEVFDYFRAAKCVVTDTFHGSIFSMVTNTEFATYIRKDPSVGATNQEKLQDLLVRFQLEDRIVFDSLEEVFSKRIDFSKVSAKRKQEYEKTVKWLQEKITF